LFQHITTILSNPLKRNIVQHILVKAAITEIIKDIVRREFENKIDSKGYTIREITDDTIVIKIKDPRAAGMFFLKQNMIVRKLNTELAKKQYTLSIKHLRVI